MLSVGSQVLIEEILNKLRWFRDQNQLSARQLVDLDLRLASLQATPEPIELSTAWYQSLTIDDVKAKMGEASQVYGQEGLSRLSQLQEKIIKATVNIMEADFNRKLILQDRDETRQEDKQVFFNSLEASVPEPGGDIVTFCLSICLTVVKPVAKIFSHKKVRECSREIAAMQSVALAEKERLSVLRMRGEEIEKAGVAIRNCKKPLEDMNGDTFIWMAHQRNVVNRSEQLIDQNKVSYLRSNVGRTVTMAQQYLHVRMNFLNEVECPESGLVRSPTVIYLKEFHNKTKDVSKHVRSLFLSTKIINEKHRNNFINIIASVAKELADILNKMKNIFTTWSRYMGQGKTETIFFRLKKEADEITRNFDQFYKEIRKCIQEFIRIYEKKCDKSNSKWLQKWQKDGDRVLEGSTWAGRPLATISEAKEVIQKLGDIADAISKISNEVMPPLLKYGDESGCYELPYGARSGREVLQTVPESLLTMISTALLVDSINLGFGNKDTTYI